MNSVYNPQKDVYNAQIGQLDPAMQADQSGLDQIKTNSFQGITDQANRRGLLFSGIPIQEQAQYTGGTYLPAVANLRNRYAQQKFNLQDAIAKIGQTQYGQANDIYQTELNRDASAAASAASSAGGGWSPGSVLGAGTTASSSSPATNAAGYTPQMQALYNQVFVKPDGGQWSDQQLVNDYNATLQSAKYGNTRDQQKIQLYTAARPDLFNGSFAAGNGGGGGGW